MKLNPVLEREIRERPRTLGAVVMLTFYLILVTTVFVLVYQAERFSSTSTRVVATSVARIGQQQYEWTLLAMLLLVLFLVPGYTASAITGERERRTLIPMQLTLLRPARIASGKASAAVAFLGLLVVATMPLLALSFVMGGVTLFQIVRGMAAVLFVGLVVAMISVCCSTLVRRTAAATVLAYGATLCLLFGTISTWGAVSGLMTANDPDGIARFAPVVLTAANPVMFVSAAIDPTDPNQALPRDNAPGAAPFHGIRSAMHGLQADTMTSTGRRALSVGPSGPTTPGPVTVQQPGPFRHFFWWSLGTMLATTGLAWLLAARRLRLPTEVER